MGRKKTKVRRAQQTKQRKAAKAAGRRKQYLKSKAQSKQGALSAEKRLAQMILNFEDSPEYLYWLAHGLNMLSSDYKEGTWTPVFPDIYEEGHQVTEDQISSYLIKHFNKDDKTWTEEGRRAVGWANSPITNIYAVVQKCTAEAQKNGADPKSPACGPVWRLFGIMRDEIQNRMGDKYLASEPTVEPT